MNEARPRPFGYESLMPNFVKDILLVASPYDRFILEEDGRFADRLLSQYVDLDLSAPPHFQHVSSAHQALERLSRDSFDLVITTPHCAELSPQQLAARIASEYPGTPVAMLAYDRAVAESYSQRPRSEGFDQVFLWTGDPKLLVALVKSVEDMLNVDHDTREGAVRVIIVVEDSPSFYSSYLPLIYGLIVDQVKALMTERLNERDRRFRSRARPKILLARSFEEGMELFMKYRDNLLGTVCDLRFPWRGKLDRQAGREFIRQVREYQPDVPVLLQSRRAEAAELAEELGVRFANKNSRELLGRVKQFVRQNFGFGPFVFMDPAGSEEVHRAEDMVEMLDAVRSSELVPDATLRYHAERNHISNWLMARSEFELAQELRPKKVSDFADTQTLRDYVVQVFARFLEHRQRGEVTEFDRSSGLARRDFTRIGSGSMGGKARGIAFISHTLAGHPIHQKYPEVRILVPRAAVLCTDIFEQYCQQDGLLERALEAQTDEELVRLFMAQPLEGEVMTDLSALLGQVRYPIAVRSSSLQEDSEFQPLAGLYKTFMLPNCAPSDALRLEQLTRAIRLIFASTFLRSTRDYMEASALRVEQERMAVILQRLVGRRHGERFYPDFAGVAQSFNYYPVGYLKPEDGVATVALGLGHSIVGGRRGLRFSPRYPEVLPQMSSPEQALRASQRDFYALDLSDEELSPRLDEGANLVLSGLEVAEADGTLSAVGATYSPENDTIYDSVYREGARLVNFAGVLKHGRFPLAPLLRDLLEIGEEGMGTAVEMEFAVSLGDGSERPEMAVLQMRPLVAQGREVEVDLQGSGAFRIPILSGMALGNGVIHGIRDVVYVHPARFRRSESELVAQEVDLINHGLEVAGRPYMLMGPGRWGTADPWLGIPVVWRQVSGAQVIVELERPDLPIDPSQGTHFFHNLTAKRVGYFTINLGDPEHLVDLDFLEKQPAQEDSGRVRHVVLERPLDVHIDGRVRLGLVFRGERRKRRAS